MNETALTNVETLATIMGLTVLVGIVGLGLQCVGALSIQLWRWVGPLKRRLRSYETQEGD